MCRPWITLEGAGDLEGDVSAGGDASAGGRSLSDDDRSWRGESPRLVKGLVGLLGLLERVVTDRVFKPEAVMSAVASARVAPVRSGMA